MKNITKNMNIEVKKNNSEELGDYTFAGYLAKYGNVDRHGDVIEKGAFKESINNKSTYQLFYNHETYSWGSQQSSKFIVGHIDLEDRPDGVYAKGVVYDVTDEQKIIYQQIKSGALSEMSIGFGMESSKDYSPILNDEGKMTGYNIIKGLIIEGSVVSVPANPEAIIEQKGMNMKSNELLEAFKNMSEEEKQAFLKSAEEETTVEETEEVEETDVEEVEEETEEVVEEETEVEETEEETAPIEETEAEAPVEEKSLPTMKKSNSKYKQKGATMTREQAVQKTHEMIGNFVKTGDATMLAQELKKSLSTAPSDGSESSSAGGTIVHVLEQQWITDVEMYGSILRHVTEKRIKAIYDVLAISGLEDAVLHDEGTDDITELDPEFKAYYINVKTVASSISYSDELDTMSTTDIGAQCLTLLNQAIIRKMEKLIFSLNTLTDNKGLRGIFETSHITDGFSTKVSLDGAEPTFEVFNNLISKVKGQGNMRWYMNWDTFHNTIMNLKDGDGRFLYADKVHGNLTDGFTFYGRPVEFSDALPALNIGTSASTDKPIVLGIDGAYEVNYPKGKITNVIFDDVTLASSGKVKLTARQINGGRINKKLSFAFAEVGVVPVP